MENFIEFTSLQHDPRFGEIVILFHKHDPKQRIMKKFLKCQNIEEFEQSKIQVKKRREIHHENILEMVDFHFNEENLTTEVFFEYPENTLELEKFKPEESIQLFLDILQAVIYLANLKMVHGDIRPEYIYLNPFTHQYILLDRLLDRTSPIQCQQNNIQKNKSLFMSPIIFNELMRKKKKIKQNSYKSELFSLGMISLLAFEDLDIIQEIYDFDEEQFQYLNLQELLNKIKKRNYPNSVIEFIDFLEKFILLENESQIIDPRKITSRTEQHPFLKKYFQTNDHSLETQEDTIISNSSVNYYNPFDFINNQNTSIKALNFNQTECVQQKDSIDSNNIQKLFMTNNNQIFEKKKSEEYIQIQEQVLLTLIKDNQDELNNLKYLSIKLQPVSPQEILKSLINKNNRISTKRYDEEKQFQIQTHQIKKQEQIKEQEQQINEQDQFDFDKEIIVEEDIQQNEFQFQEEHQSNSSQYVQSDQKNDQAEQMKNYFTNLGIEFQNETVQPLQKILDQKIQLEEALKKTENFEKVIQQRQQEKMNLKQFLQKEPTLSYRRVQRHSSMREQKRNFGMENIFSLEQTKVDKRISRGIEKNFQMMNINPNKQIDKKFRKSIQEIVSKQDKQGNTFFFNAENLSRSPSKDKKTIRSKSCRRFEDNYEPLQNMFSKQNEMICEQLEYPNDFYFSQENLVTSEDSPEKLVFQFPADLILKEICFKFKMLLMGKEDQQFNKYIQSLKSIDELNFKQQSIGSNDRIQSSQNENFMQEHSQRIPSKINSNEELINKREILEKSLSLKEAQSILPTLQERYSQRKQKTTSFQKLEIEYLSPEQLNTQVNQKQKELEPQSQKQEVKIIQKKQQHIKRSSVNVLNRVLVKGRDGKYYYKLNNQNY